MVKKYIIELEEPEMFDDRKFYTCTQMPWWAVSENIVENLTPYTEPDLEQVRKEAYDEGYDDAKGCYENGFENGMIVAWDAAREIAAIPYDEGEKIFGATGWHIIMKYTASEVIAKIKAWKEKKQEIKVGDEVGYYGVADEHGNVCYSGVVLEIREDDYFVMEKTGKTYALKKNLAQGKTGRHFPEIAAVLEKMRGESND